MRQISVDEMAGGRFLINVAHFSLEAAELSLDWGEGERFEEELDLGPRHIYCWQLVDGTFVSLNRVEDEHVPGFAFNVRSDSDDPAAMRAILQNFLEESGLAEDRIIERIF